MKAVWIVFGILCFVFAVAQILQAAGLIGTKTLSLPGVAFIILGFALSAGCFKKAFEPGEQDESSSGSDTSRGA